LLADRSVAADLWAEVGQLEADPWVVVDRWAADRLGVDPSVVGSLVADLLEVGSLVADR